MILNDILDFSKIEADGIELEPQSTDVWQLAHDTTDLMTASAGQKGLGLACTISDSVPRPNSISSVLRYSRGPRI